MIRGTVNARREAALRLRVLGPHGTAVEVEAVVDTGFTGSLVLPPAIVAACGLTRLAESSARLADGAVRRFDTFAATVEWGETLRQVVASALGGEALVGMGMLAGHELRMEVEPGGAVEIVPLRPSGTAAAG